MQLQANEFTSYILTQEEEITGKTLTPLQLAVFQNRLALVASSKLALTYDTSNHLAFLQQEAEMQGQMLLLKQIIAESTGN